MATMYNTPDPSTDSLAEQRIFDWLKKLPDEFRVVYDWRLRTGQRELQADFVIVNPHWAVPLVLEVKGGGISRHGTNWTSHDRNHHSHRIKDPIRQAQDAAYELHRRMSSRQHGHSIDGQHTCAAWCLAFPDTDWNTDTDDLRKVLVINRQEIKKDPYLRIIKIFESYNPRKQAADPTFVKRAIHFTVPQATHRIVSPIDEENRDFILLDEQQYGILKMLSNQNRLAINGVAGSGKTVIAINAARAAVEDNKRALYICYNKQLYIHVWTRYGIKYGFDAYTYDALVSACKAGRLGDEDRYDAIFVDEGQDLAPNAWDVIENRLINSVEGRVWLFYDLDQAPRHQEAMMIDHLLSDGNFVTTDRLLTNYRNTKEITKTVAQYGDRDMDSPSLAPDGLSVKQHTCSTSEDAIKRVACQICDWISGDDSIDVSDIALLVVPTGASGEVRENEISYKQLKDKMQRITADLSNTRHGWDNHIFTKPRWATAGGFKALEAKAVVVITQWYAIADGRTGKLASDLYVGTSRARHRLLIVELPLDYRQIARVFWREFHGYTYMNARSHCHMGLHLPPLFPEQIFREIEIRWKTGESFVLSFGLGRSSVRVFVRGAIDSGDDGLGVAREVLKESEDVLTRALGVQLGNEGPLLLQTHEADFRTKDGLLCAVKWLSDKCSEYVKVLKDALGVSDEWPWKAEFDDHADRGATAAVHGRDIMKKFWHQFVEEGIDEEWTLDCHTRDQEWRDISLGGDWIMRITFEPDSGALFVQLKARVDGDSGERECLGRCVRKLEKDLDATIGVFSREAVDWIREKRICYLSDIQSNAPNYGESASVKRTEIRVAARKRWSSLLSYVVEVDRNWEQEREEWLIRLDKASVSKDDANDVWDQERAEALGGMDCSFARADSGASAATKCIDGIQRALREKDGRRRNVLNRYSHRSIEKVWNSLSADDRARCRDIGKVFVGKGSFPESESDFISAIHIDVMNVLVESMRGYGGVYTNEIRECRVAFWGFAKSKRTKKKKQGRKR